MKHALVILAAILVPFLISGFIQKKESRARIDKNQLAVAFSKWQQEYGQLFASPSEKHYRMEIFEQNMIQVMETNSKQTSYQLGLNQFAHLSDEEFSAMYTGLVKLDTKRRSTKPKPKVEAKPEPSLLAAGDQLLGFDWNREYQMNEILHQGSCGSCYAWSAVDALNHGYFMKTRHQVRFSVQELVDCSKGEGNQGCKGGFPDWAWNYIIKNKGISLEREYPYIGQESDRCKAVPSKKVDIGLEDTVEIAKGDHEALKLALREQLVPTSICAKIIKLYKGGVLTEGLCESAQDHAVTFVGYGVSEKGEKYWKIRNSWGATWGEQGHIRILRQEIDKDKPQIAGILDYVVYPKFS